MSDAPSPDLQPLQELLAVMARLRGPDGCPWDRRQTFASIAPHTLEEAYEVVEAIRLGDLDELCDELGDLLFQVVFHARLGEELGAFAFTDVARAIVDKLVRRHPHVFAGADPAAADWEAIKAAERAQHHAPGTPASALDGVALALPALSRAAKLQRRAARAGCDWDAWQGPWARLREAVGELGEALERPADTAALEHELGDLLFAGANLARHLDVDPEAACRRAGERFERRFRQVEDGVAGTGRSLADYAPGDLERRWLDATRHDR